jgi:hypothetical protein
MSSSVFMSLSALRLELLALRAHSLLVTRFLSVARHGAEGAATAATTTTTAECG